MTSSEPEPPTDSIPLRFETVPDRPVARFEVTIEYENVPAGAGLNVGIRSIVRGGGGGWLDPTPRPIEGSGRATFTFTGKAASAPADFPAFIPVRAGEYRIYAMVFSTREGQMRMLRPKGHKIAEALSEPITLTGTGDSRIERIRR